MWEIFASATATFMFVRGFSLVSRGREMPDKVPFDGIAGPSFKPFAGAGIAIFLLAFIAGEALTTVRAFRPESSAAGLAPGSPAVLSGLVTLPIAIPEKRSTHRTLDNPGRAISRAAQDRLASLSGRKAKIHLRSGSNSFLPAN